MTEDQLRGLSDFESSPAFTEGERGALRYEDSMTATPLEVPEHVFEGLRSHYDDAQIVELTSSIAWQNYRARFDHALGVEAEGFSEGAFCPLPSRR